jgi:DNA-binding PucR family transcriptional regulator
MTWASQGSSAPPKPTSPDMWSTYSAQSPYDAQRGRDLVGTLRAYFAAGRSPTRAAAALHVRPNTVQQRLDRISALLGEGWQQPERARDVQVALRLRATLS